MVQITFTLLMASHSLSVVIPELGSTRLKNTRVLVIVLQNKKIFYRFKAHIVINLSGMISGYTFAPAHCDERDVALEITNDIYGLLEKIRAI